MWRKVPYSKTYEKLVGDVLMAEVYRDGNKWKGQDFSTDRKVEAKTAKEAKSQIDE